MMQLNNAYNRDDFLQFLANNFLTDFKKNIRPANTQGFSSIQRAYSLGRSESLDLQVFEFSFEGSPNKRVTLTKDAFQVMRSSAIFRALAIFHSPDSNDWRLSLMTATPERTEKGKVALSYSNPKRLSFFLGPNAKINTPTKFILKKDKITDFEDLKNRFSVEVVNKEFYNEISQAFTKLVGGLLKLPSTPDKSQISLEFAVRLIGRVIFCWFLREKKSQAGISLMPKELLSLEAVGRNDDYYHKILEPIFFEVLNKPVKSRRTDFAKEPFASIPYLNGGLFSPQYDDYYKRANGDFQSQYHNTLIVPDDWFADFFKILETYNFTIDENTSYDEELSIDPEMLGRIFENLLAEINPETGESARKSTGSYYTPRTIVSYMVDESLLLYLKEQTGIKEEKLRAVISYDLDDDLENPVTVEEKEKIIEALEKVKILDPACGSGAFPIGALQKIVFILQQTDPEGRLWFKKQTVSANPEFRRDIESKFSNNELDFIRKLGVIRNSIYGVDIQPIATEISRLRCLLTLIVDEVVKDNDENRGIKPLPNLDFKFVTANSLIGLPKMSANIVQDGLFEDRTNIDQLKKVRTEYFGANGLEREQLRTEFEQIQKSMFKHMVGMKATSDLTHKLSNWEPFAHRSAEWFDPDWMFGIKDGFDIVIANPPYVKEYVNKSAFTYLRKSSYYQGKMDLWYMFACNGIDLLKDKTGVLCFIAQNNWVTSYGASKMRRKVIEDTQIINIIDFGDYKVFEAGIQTMVMVFKKSKELNEYTFDFRRFDANNLSLESLENILSNYNSPNVEYLNPTVNRNVHIGKKLTFSNNRIENVLNKIVSKSNFRLDNNEVANGIHHHHDRMNKERKSILGDKFKINDGIFVINDKEKDELNLSRKEYEIIKPSYTTKELVRWFANPKNKEWVIYTDSSFKDKNKINDYPNIKRHLDFFVKVITSDNKPYGLHRSRDEKFFKGEKIVVPRKSDKPNFSYVDFDSYVSATFYVIKTERLNQKYLTGLLNSTLISFWLKNKGKMQGNNYQLDKEPIIALPLLKTDSESEERIVKVVDQILQIVKLSGYVKTDEGISKVNEFEKILNNYIYQLYGLEDEEIKIVEGSISKK